VIAIGLEADATLVLDQKRALREAERHGISVVGLRPEEG
jgi:DUF1009 family protein